MFIADNGGFHSSGAVTKFAAITVEVCFIFFEMFSLSTTSIRLIAVDCFFVLLAFFSPFDRNLQRHVDRIQL